MSTLTYHGALTGTGALPMIPTNTLIPTVVARLLRDAPLTPEKVSLAWRTAVGPAIGRVSTARLGEAGVLHVTVGDPRWHSSIQKATPLVLDRLAGLLGPGVVTRIVATASKD